MTEAPEHNSGWWAKGLLFENCSCQLVCPGHVHFSQSCDGDRCVGYWAIRFDGGEFEGVSLAGLKAAVAFIASPKMIDGGWTESILIDSGASEPQKQALERLFSGEIGGPWEVLARFVSKRTPTRMVDIVIEDRERNKRLFISGIVEATVEAIRGRNKAEPVTFENMFNQIHPPSQVLARGETHYDDGAIVFVTRDTHGLYSSFDWSGNATQ